MILRVLKELSQWEKVILLIYLLLLAVGVFSHEAWTDELRPWIIARDTDFAGLFRMIRDEFHPPGWYLLLKLLTWLGFSPIAMPVIAALGAGMAFAIMLRYAPFTLLQKGLLGLNAYLLYQYGIMGRPYSLELLCLFILCALYERRKEHVVLWSLMILALSLTHAFGVLMAPIFLIRMILDFIGENTFRRKIAIVLLVATAAILGVLSLTTHLFTNIHGVMAPGDIFLQRLTTAIAFSFQSVFLLLPFNENWWERSFWNGSAFVTYTMVALSFAGLLMFYRSFRKDRFPFLFFCYGSGLIVLFLTFYRYAGFNLNHLGQVFLFLICSLWMLRSSGGKILTLSFLLTAVAGGFMFVSDVLRPASSGSAVGQWLNQNPGREVVSEIPFFSSAWVAYTDQKFMTRSGAKVTVVPGTAEILTDMKVPEFYPLTEYEGYVPHSSDEYLKENLRLAKCASGKAPLLISNYAFSDERMTRLCLENVAIFGGAINPLENFFIFRMKTADTPCLDNKLRCLHDGSIFEP